MPNLWPPNSPDLNPMDYQIYHRQIHILDELKRWLIDVSCGLEQLILTRLLISGDKDIESVSVL